MLIFIFLHHGHIIDSHYSFLPPFVQFASGSSPTPPPVPLLYTQSLLNNVNNGFPNRFIPNTHHHHSQTTQQIPFLHFKSEFFILSISHSFAIYILSFSHHLAHHTFFFYYFTRNLSCLPPSTAFLAASYPTHTETTSPHQRNEKFSTNAR